MAALRFGNICFCWYGVLSSFMHVQSHICNPTGLICTGLCMDQAETCARLCMINAAMS